MQIPGYQIERELGQGGMAIVYLALQESLHRHVALKVIKPVLTTDEEFAQRFLREGRIIAQLSDPHIVTVYDIASYEGTYYLSMEYLPGGTLQQRIRNGLSLTEALSIAKAMVGALHYAHRRSIIHRDIKPQNILFRENGQPVLTDFGIAKTLGASTIMTRTGLSLGTPRYMSPEQIRGQGVDARADLYSFGVLFYEMLTGSVPYTADDSFALAMMHVTAPIPTLPPHLRRFQPLLNKLLDKDPDQRFQSGEEIVAAITASEAGTFRLPGIHRPAHSTSRSGWKIGVPAAILASAALAGGYWFLYRPTLPIAEPPVVSTPTPPPAPELPAISTPAPSPTPEPPAVDVEAQLQQAAAQEQQRQAQLQAEQFLEQAQRARQEGSLQMSLVHIEQGLQAMPSHPGLLSLKQDVTQQRADLQRQEEAARRQAEAAEQAKAETEQRQRKADELLARALDDQRNRAYESSLLRIEQGLQQAPEHRRLLALRDEVRQQLREAKAAPPPTPAVKPPIDDTAKIAALLRQCETHLQANRLTTGKGGNAADCYGEVLKRDRSSAEALAGLDRIADRYADLASTALQRNDVKSAHNSLARIEKLNPSHPQLSGLREQLALAETPKSVAPPPKPEPLPKPEPPLATPEPETPAVPPIHLVSVPQPTEQPPTTPETRVVAQDQHTRISRTQTNDDVSLQITTSPQGILDEASRAAAKKQIPAGTPAQLFVRADVEDAEIWINNRKVGTVPMQIEMRPGSYRVRVRQEGYTDWNGKVDLAPGDESSITAVLPRKLATASVAPVAERRRSEEPAPEAELPEEKPAPPRAPETQTAKASSQAANCLSGNCENGRGTYRYPDGSEYSGDFRNAKMHGQGTYVYAGRGEKYVGEWRNGVINGQGTYYYRSGNRYDGEWRNGRKSGQGTYLYAGRGDKYVGEFANDQPNGQGVYYYSNGDRYEGEWRNGRKHGQGVLYENGLKIVGEWQNDQKAQVRVEQ
jgi:serine/threonine protein kinase